MRFTQGFLGLSEQTQHALRALVCDSKNGSTRLDQDLGSRQCCRFLCEVGISNRAFGFGQVGQRVAQGDRVGVEGRSLERAQTSSKSSDFFDDLVDDRSSPTCIGFQSVGFAATELVESAANPTEGTGVHRTDSESSLLAADNAGS